MRLFANQYRQYYGPQQFNYAGGAILGGAHNITAGAGIAALTEWAGNANTVGTNSLAIGQSAAGAGTILQRGSNALAIGNGQGTLTVAGATGGWTIAQPAAAATALSITGFGGNYVAALVASNSGGVSQGLSITGPSASQLNAIVLQQTGQNSWTLLQAASSSALQFYSNSLANLTLTSGGGMQIGSPTGGDQGAGTLNATGLYVNGGQLFFGVPASSNTTAAVTDVGKVINATGTITIPNSVFSQGHALSIYNNSGSSITISASITTMRLAGTATTGSRTLAQRGMATIWFESGTECVVGGPGVT